MAEKPTNAPREEDSASSQPVAAPAKTPFYTRFLTAKWLLIVVGFSIVLHVAGLAYYRLRQRPAPLPDTEIGLGNFHFEADRGEGGGISKADFSLHIAPAGAGEPQGRAAIGRPQVSHPAGRGRIAPQGPQRRFRGSRA